MICDKWLHIYGNKLGTEANCEWVDDVRENVRGEWKLRKNQNLPMWHWYECSNCGAVIGTPTRFCSECGADMRGGQHD